MWWTLEGKARGGGGGGRQEGKGGGEEVKLVNFR